MGRKSGAIVCFLLAFLLAISAINLIAKKTSTTQSMMDVVPYTFGACVPVVIMLFVAIKLLLPNKPK